MTAFTGASLYTPDPPEAARYYAILLGLENLGGSGSVERPILLGLADHVHLTVAEFLQEERERGSWPTWVPAFDVARCDETVKFVADLGGRQHNERMGSGQTATVDGPTGEAFMVSEPSGFAGSESVAWGEVVTANLSRAATFYRDLFGWQLDDVTDPAYPMLVGRNGPVAGMMELNEIWNDDAFLAAIGRKRDDRSKAPPHWMVHLACGNLARAAARVKGLGGRIMVPPSKLSTLGRYMMIRDPQGVFVCIVQRKTTSNTPTRTS